MSKQHNILFIHLGESSFVKEDLRILSKFGKLDVFYFSPSKSVFQLLKNFILQFFWLISKVYKADFIYCWFSDYHGVLPLFFSKVFKVPFFTVLGGFDCNKIKSLDYGIFCSPWRAPLGAYILKNSTLLLPVDKHLISTSNNSKYWEDAHPNGVESNVPNFFTPWQALPTGYTSEAWPEGPLNRENIVSTVALVSNHKTSLIKGWDLFIEVARLMPEFSFKIIGASKNFIDLFKKKYALPSNIQISPPMPREALVQVYHQTSIYLQLSRAEGLPNVLCEAMMCGCIPIGSPVFGIPAAIGDVGFIAEHPEPQNIAELIWTSQHDEENIRVNARKHIIENFSLQRRENELRSIFNSYRS